MFFALISVKMFFLFRIIKYYSYFCKEIRKAYGKDFNHRRKGCRKTFC